MRDYYLEFISNQGEKTQKPSDDEGTKGAEGAFVPIAPLPHDVSSTKNLVERFGFPAEEPDEEESIIFEERVAVMMYDGGLTEVEAIEYLTLNANRTNF
jgi:hypothetical protein